MNDQGKPSDEKYSEIEQIECKVCMKHVPISEAKIAEASDYVLHFCGLECYKKWRAQQKNHK